MISYNNLFQVCVKYTGDRYYVAQVMPLQKLANARASFPIPENETTVALIDTTMFGSGKTGLAITNAGIRWRNGLNTWAKGPKKMFLRWADFASAPINYRGVLNVSVQIGLGTEFALSSTDMNKKELVQLLSDIQGILRSPRSASSGRQWMLAVSDRQFGPYNLQTIREMLEEGQIDPDECWAWQEGWRNWVHFVQVPELQALRNIGSHSQSSPPPLPTVPSSAKTDHVQIDLNNAAEEELLALPDVDLSAGRRLIRERDKRGGFSTVEEAGHFLNLQPHQIQRFKERVQIGPYRAAHGRGGRVVDF